MHFYPRLYSLPGGMEPNGQLRRCLADLDNEYPGSMSDPMAFFRAWIEEQKHLARTEPYEGDLETDFLRSLGEIQRSAKEKPVQIEMDFRKRRK